MVTAPTLNVYYESPQASFGDGLLRSDGDVECLVVAVFVRNHVMVIGKLIFWPHGQGHWQGQVYVSAFST